MMRHSRSYSHFRIKDLVCFQFSQVARRRLISVAYLLKSSTVVSLGSLGPKPSVLAVELENESSVIRRVVRPHQKVVGNFAKREYSKSVQVLNYQFQRAMIAFRIGHGKSGLLLRCQRARVYPLDLINKLRAKLL